MKAKDRYLDRLLAAAAAARRESPTELPFTVEARILAHWRATRAGEDPLTVLAFFRRGLALACALMLATLAISLQQLRTDSADAWSGASTILNVALYQ